MSGAKRSFDQIYSEHFWRPIRHCPGRFICRGNARGLHPSELIGSSSSLVRLVTAHAVDPTWVAEIPGGGIISYEKKDGSFVHTLNTSEAFRRKLSQLSAS